jgi:hypothetical protein
LYRRLYKACPPAPIGGTDADTPGRILDRYRAPAILRSSATWPPIKSLCAAGVRGSGWKYTFATNDRRGYGDAVSIRRTDLHDAGKWRSIKYSRTTRCLSVNFHGPFGATSLSLDPCVIISSYHRIRLFSQDEGRTMTQRRQLADLPRSGALARGHGERSTPLTPFQNEGPPVPTRVALSSSRPGALRRGSGRRRTGADDAGLSHSNRAPLEGIPP